MKFIIKIFIFFIFMLSNNNTFAANIKNKTSIHNQLHQIAAKCCDILDDIIDGIENNNYELYNNLDHALRSYNKTNDAECLALIHNIVAMEFYDRAEYDKAVWHFNKVMELKPLELNSSNYLTRARIFSFIKNHINETCKLIDIGMILLLE